MAASKPQSTREEIIASIGDLSQLEIMHNQILVGIWMRPQKTAGGIILTDKTVDEDKWQGKVGLVLKKGPQAFKSDSTTDFAGQNVEEGDWLLYRVSDGFAIDINGTHCRLLEDVHIKGRVSDPSVIY
jgi:co-chaperonin GroES (HSP10)